MSENISRKKPKQKRSLKMMEQILEGAQKSAEKFGLDKITTAKISDVTGISVGSFYQYFKNKEAVIVTLAKQVTQGTFVDLDNTLDEIKDKNAFEQIEQLVEVFIRHAYEKKEYINMVPKQVMNLNQGQFFLSIRYKLYEKLAKRIQEFTGKDINECYKFAFFVISNLNGTIHMMFQDPKEHISKDEVEVKLKKVAQFLFEDFNNKTIFHIATKEDWAKATKNGYYIHPSLESEGFIHFSTSEQVTATANRFFSGKEGLLLLKISTKRIQSRLVYEYVEELDTYFPHLYGTLNLDAISVIDELHEGEDGFIIS